MGRYFKIVIANGLIIQQNIYFVRNRRSKTYKIDSTYNVHIKYILKYSFLFSSVFSLLNSIIIEAYFS